MGKKSIEELLNAQTELLKNLQETNRHWLEIVQSEAALASKFATKLTTTRSIPDAMTTCQEWSNRQIEMMAEDCKLLVADTQRFMETGARFLSAAGGPTVLTAAPRYDVSRLGNQARVMHWNLSFATVVAVCSVYAPKS